MKKRFIFNKVAAFFLALLVIVSGHLCSHNQIPKIEFQEINIVKTNSYQFNIKFQSAQTYFNKNTQNGTHFIGKFSTVTIKNRQNQSFQFEGSQLSFQCPAIHRPRKIKQQIIQMQIIHKPIYRFASESIKQQRPFKAIILSFPFMISEFVPAKNKQLSSYLNSSFVNGQKINFENLLTNHPQMPIIIYKGKHSRFPNQEVLYMVRKQLRLLSKGDSEQIQILIRPEAQLQKMQTQKGQTKSTVPTKLYQIKPFKSQQKQDL